MSRYRVYKVGEDEPVRVAGDAGPEPAPKRPPSRVARHATTGASTGAGTWVKRVLIALAVIAVGALFWFYGRDALGNAWAAFDIARLSDKVPGWAFYAAPVFAALVVVLVTAYVAFGRHVVLKVILLTLVVLALAAPGVAVGWVNGQIDVVGTGTTAELKMVKDAKKVMVRPLPGKPMNILLIGTDHAGPGDPGRSDSQILVRLDPATKSISLLSVPRDWRVDIAGVGLNKMNAAYSYGGAALVAKTFTQVTGIPINHFVQVDFKGFWHVVQLLGGIYIPVDHRYYFEDNGITKVSIEPGYQPLDGDAALKFVRFRHDAIGDFGRMQRQQLFLKEMQRQSGRWSSNWHLVLKLIKAITDQTKSDINSLRVLKPLVELIFQVNTSKFYTVHIEGATPMIGGVSYVVPSQQQISDAVNQFEHPTQAPIKVAGLKLTKKMYPVRISNASGVPGLDKKAAAQLTAQGYKTEVGAEAPEFPGKVTVVYAPKSLAAPAQLIGEMFYPSDVRIVDRTPGLVDGINVFVTSSFDGTIVVPTVQAQPQQTLVQNQRYAASSWRALDRQTPIHLEMPTAWSPGFTYDQFRSYRFKTTSRTHTPATVAVGMTPSGGYFSFQAMRWQDPPAIQNPNSTQVIGGTQYLLFYQADHLHMVAWKRDHTVYWVMNTMTNELSNDLMMGLATSFKPVK